MDQQEGTRLWPWIATFAGIGAVVTILWLISWALITRQLGNPMNPGPFGDMFGAVNALFSGYAFAGIIVAILMQRLELKAQREESARSTKAQQGLGRAAAIEAQLQANIFLHGQTSALEYIRARSGQAVPDDTEIKLDIVRHIENLLTDLEELGKRPDTE